MKLLAKPAFLMALALLVLAGIARQHLAGLLFFVVAVLVFGGGGKALARTSRRHRVSRAHSRKTRRAAAQREDLAVVNHAIKVRRAAEAAHAKEARRIQLAAARRAAVRQARVDAGLDPDTGRPPR